jgi:hypothetical protein
VEQTDATRGLATQNDPDGNKEKIGWAASAQAEPFTDIAVTDIQAPTSIVQGVQASIEVTVQNVGNQDVGAFNVILMDNGATIGSHTVSTLSAGASTILTYSWDTSTCSLSVHTLTAEHDLDDDNTANDSAETSTTVVAVLTDIAITAVSGPGSVVQGNIADILVTVENVGNQDVTADVYVTLADTTDAADIDTLVISGGLVAGASTTLTFSWDTTGFGSGEHNLVVEHDVADDDAANNSSSMTVTVAEQSAAETVNVSVAVTPWFSFRRGWKAAATVIVADDDGLPVLYTTIEGEWSGVYNATVTGSTDNSGLELFITKAIRTAGTVTFTVKSITGSDGQVYVLDPEVPKDSYTGP